MSDRLTSDDIQRFLSEASRINLFSASDLNLKDPLEHNRLQQILSLTSNIESNLVPEILNRKLARAVTYCITSCSSPRLKESVQERELLGDLGLVFLKLKSTFRFWISSSIVELRLSRY